MLLQSFLKLLAMLIQELKEILQDLNDKFLYDIKFLYWYKILPFKVIF